MKRNVMQPQLVHEVMLLGGKIALGEQLAGEVIVPAKRRNFAR